MPERSSYAPGVPSWVDLATTDPAAARDFYGQLFGWEFDVSPDEQLGHYTTVTKDGKDGRRHGRHADDRAAAGLGHVLRHR